MASNKKSNNSNKTARVMNLLSRNREAAPAEESLPQEQEGAAEAIPAAHPAAPAANPTASAVSNLMSSLHPDAAVSSQIKSALEADLAAELGDAASAPAAPAEQPEQPAMTFPSFDEEEDLSEPAAESEAPELPELPEAPEAPEEAALPETPELPETPAPAAPVQAAPVVEEAPAAPAPQPEPPVAEAKPAQPEQPAQSQAAIPSVQPAVSSEDTGRQPSKFHDLIYVNVMQQLVEEAAPKYMRLYGVCTCPRCQVDVKALALCGLPSKYVVMRKGEMVPRISVYEGKYSAAVTAQLLWACKLVMEKPHHGR